MTNRPKIYFLGSGVIAIPILRAVATAKELELIGVGTQLSRPAGRNRKPTPTPVGAAALEIGIEPEQVPSVNAPDFIERLRRKRPDIVLVVSFGQILRRELLELPSKGCVNIHASLLPRYRGASPIVQCILNQDTETGVSFMAMERGLDTGAVYRTVAIPLDHSEYAGELEFKLGAISAEVAPGILCDIFRGDLEPIPQDGLKATVCTKIRKTDGLIRWTESEMEIEAMVRAYCPWPGAFSAIRSSKGEEFVTLSRVAARRDLSGRPGEVLQADKYGLLVGCGRGAIEIFEIAPPGRRSMPATAYLNGLRGEIPEFLPR
ncbi:MAG: methionyl-tRNA formyltransferase [Victivallales bacterium]|nr:methionyl-tRNA formyltransferase [Victivallales bacterium]